MNNDIFSRISGDECNKNAVISIIQQLYVDDSNNVISTENAEELQLYINKYFGLIEAFYNINKLKINPDKSKIMIVCKPKFRNNTKNMVLQMNKHTIEQVQK